MNDCWTSSGTNSVVVDCLHSDSDGGGGSCKERKRAGWQYGFCRSDFSGSIHMTSSSWRHAEL